MIIATIAQLMVSVGMDLSGFNRGNNEVKGSLKSLVGDIAKISAAAMAGVAVALAPIASYGLKISSDMQQAKISMETMLGSTEKADAMIKDLWAFAASTPFEFNQLQTATKRMLAFGFSAEDIIPDLTAVGNAAAGLGVGAEGVNRITLALGQMKAKSKVSGDEMLQLTEAGIPAWGILAESIGKSTAEVMKLAEKGVIPADQAIQALLAGMSEKFPNMMEKQSKSMEGLFSTLKDNVTIVLIELFKPAVQWLTDVGLPKLIEMTGNFSDTIKNGGSITEAINSMFSGGFDGVLSQMGVVGEMLQSIGNAISWAKDNANLLIPVLIELAAAFVALQIIQSILGPIEALVVAGIVLVSVISAICIAMGNMAAAAAIAPILAELIAVFMGLTMISVYVAIAVLAIGALIAIGYLLYDNWEPIKAWFIGLWNDIVSFVSDNIMVLCALFPMLGLAAYVIYEYWGDAVNAANRVITWLAEQVAWATDKIINNFQWYLKMWDDFVGWAKQGVADFKVYLSDLVDSFIPQWASSMLSGVQSLGQKLASKTAEIGKAMRNNLTIGTVSTEVKDIPYSSENPDFTGGTGSTVYGPSAAPAGIKAPDWSSADFTGGGTSGGGSGGGGSGVSDEKKAANDAAKAFEDLQKAAKATSDSIKSEWISLTGTQMDALNNWHDKELDDLNKSASANENYTNDLSRLDEIYAAKKKKILEDQQKDSNSVWDKALSDAKSLSDQLAEINLTGGSKLKFDLESDAIGKITEIKQSARDVEQDYLSITNEMKLQSIEAWTANGKQFTITKNGMKIDAAELAASVIAGTANMSNTQVDLSQDTATRIKAINDKLAIDTNNNYASCKDIQANIDAAFAVNSMANLQKTLTTENAMKLSSYAAQQSMMETYQAAFLAAHSTTAQLVADLYSGAFGGLQTALSGIFDGTKSVSDAFKGLGQTMLKVVTDYAAKWLASRLMMAVFGKTTMAAETAASMAAGVATAVAWAPAAAMVSLASFGANSAPAMAGIAATTALSAGLAIAGLATGGPVNGPGTGTSDSILTWLSNGEYVIKADAVRSLGLGTLDTLNTGKMPAYATGGLVTGRSLSSVGSSGYNTSIDSRNVGNSVGGQPSTIAVTQNNYGDINTDADYDRMNEDFGDLIQSALMGV